MSPDADLFDWGFDSLSATILRLRLVSALRTSPDDQRVVNKINQGTIYLYRTVRTLAQFVCTDSDDTGSESEVQVHIRKMEDMIAKYSTGLDTDISTASDSDPRDANHTPNVLLTGSTGSLGSRLLHDILTSKHYIGTIYVLNRSPPHSARSKQTAKFVDQNLDIHLLDTDRIVYLTLGTSPLPTDVDLIIHNAWKLDFNLTLEGFEENIKDLRELIDHVRSLPHRPRLLFTSSISTAHSWDGEGGFPERTMDAAYAVGGGYGEAKYVCERVSFPPFFSLLRPHKSKLTRFQRS